MDSDMNVKCKILELLENNRRIPRIPWVWQSLLRYNTEDMIHERKIPIS
jgi:hypothetical protein